MPRTKPVPTAAIAALSAAPALAQDTSVPGGALHTLVLDLLPPVLAIVVVALAIRLLLRAFRHMDRVESLLEDIRRAMPEQPLR